MARFFDKIGYELPGSNVNGVWTADITERDHYGEVLDATRTLAPSDKANDDFRLQNRISIVADAFASENFAYIKYVSWRGVRWEALSVSVVRPRLIITLGGVYRGRLPEDPAPASP